MEFQFNVNAILQDEVTIVTSNTYLSGKAANNLYRQELDAIINTAGELSAQAQGLKKPITSAVKLRNSDHRLYIIKDDSSHTASVVGILRTGYKKLFLLDKYGVQNEVVPLCLLDFYIHDSKQRHGYGNKLYQYMIQNENARCEHIAIDRPSPKLISFMKKHYGLVEQIPQVIKFTIFKGFFHNRQDDVLRRSGNDKYMLDDVYRHRSNNNVWLYDEREALKLVGSLSNGHDGYGSLNSLHSLGYDSSRGSTPDTDHQQRALAAQGGGYSRYAFTPTPASKVITHTNSRWCRQDVH